MARVSYVEAADATGDAQKVLQGMEERGTEILNLFRALGHSQSALRNFMRLGNSLLTHGTLPPKLRELAVLRVSQVSKADYEWAHHVPIALAAGVSQEQIDAMSAWEGSSSFDDVERAVIGYAESAATAIVVPDEIFREARKHLSEEEIVELTVAVGYWGMVARVLVALEVDVEPSFTKHLPAAR